MSFLEEFSHLRIPLEDIIQATNNFSCENLMGENCYGKMYKGKFLRPDGFVTFTFEQLKKAPDESGPRKFSQDIKFSGFKHDNILSLVGFCDEQDETILVHEFATHGSLDRYLRSANLTWLKRLQICLDAARGLEYLHDPGKTQIKVVLGNVGSANIQLDQNWHAKIANFSSSRYLQQTEQVSEYGYSTTSTQLTYMDTTSTEKDIITTATDTYCFGLVLMEVLCGRQAYEEYQPSLGPEACEHYKEGKLTEIIDPNLRKQMSVDSLDLFSAIAYQCLKNNQEPPRMFEVVEKLEEVLEYQLQFEQALALLQEEFAHLRIPLEHITQATKNFADENVIVSDYDGKMYKGELLQHGGRVTATFKQVDNKFDQGSLEILKEILPLFEYRHENIDFPIGFCDEGNKIILVHEFQTHGNLSKHLSSANLTWLKRLKICLDAARGLNYLHNPPGIQTRALHRDLTSANILLDGNWHGKLANLCLSNYHHKNDKHIFLNTNVTATLAYMDPAYTETGILTKKSDIYSFGVILMETLCARLPHVKGMSSLGTMACFYYKEGKLTDIVYPFLRKQMSADSLDVFLTIAYKCLKNNRMERPTVFEVVKELEEAVELQQKFEEVSAVPQEDFDYLRIPMENITQATNNFAYENFIVGDDYGKMYKGELLQPRGRVTATFKQFDNTLGQGSQKFLKEIMPLFGYRHENIDFPIGFCDEGNKIILVHEVQTNGSLSRHLSSANLTWLKRLQICLDAARGLNYLHNTSRIQTRAFHRDLKSANIVLDGNWHAKLANLCLSNYLQKNDEPTFLDANDAATLAYMDPAYSETGILTIKSDIYSFGIVLMEALCGRLAHVEGKPSLGPMACLYYEEGKLSEIIHPFLRKQMSVDSLDVFSAIAYKCLKNNQMERPGILEVVKELQEVLGLQKKFEEASAHQQVRKNLKGIQEHEENKLEDKDDVYKVRKNLKGIQEHEENKLEDKDDVYKVKTMEYMKIPLKDIKSATHDFHEHFKIGRGGFGDVYKADLFHFDFRKYVIDNRVQRLTSAELSNYPRRRSTVAIKRLDRRYGQGTAEFLQELSVLPYFKHKNVVTLVGFCDEDRECILVYEYASNGSLQDHIQSANTTHSHTWARRLQICLDAAYGLEFLHNGLGEHYRIIHRDIKSSNILLGQNYIGMISDFGLSKIGPANREATCVMTQVAGTPLYIDPEYQKTNMLTKKSDVYSFGVVLFEALSGRLVHSGSSKDDPEFVLKMAKCCFEQRNVKEIIHSNFKTEFEKAGSSIQDDETCPDSIHIFAAIAYKCCKDKREDRPTMVEVVKELEKALKSHVNRVEATRITLGDIRSATNDFRDIIEQGPPGEVYCGELSYLKGRGTVTIKRLHPSVDSSGEEFVKEIARLYSYSHENVVPVLGFCEEGTERIIVLEHMVKGSLKDHLTNTSLMWKQRLKICIDAAYGLAYIHSHADQTEHMVHGDLKSSSILLGDDWKAAISDFIVFKGAGTLGYLDPLYATTSSLTQESEVYSFGVILFEILSGRLANERIEIDQQQPPLEVPNVELQLNTASCTCNDNEPVAFLANWASKCFKNKKIEDIIFHAIKKEIEPMSLVIFSTIANQCLMEQRTDRPTMTKVVEELEKALDCQDEWEWEQKLPTDYKEIIQMSKRPLASTIRKKDIHSLLSSGMLLHNEKWFSISMDGARNEMASAKTFSYGDVSSVKWKSVQKSRFPKVARIPDISNLNIKIKLKTQFLTPECWPYTRVFVSLC